MKHLYRYLLIIICTLCLYAMLPGRQAEAYIALDAETYPDICWVYYFNSERELQLEFTGNVLDPSKVYGIRVTLSDEGTMSGSFVLESDTSGYEMHQWGNDDAPDNDIKLMPGIDGDCFFTFRRPNGGPIFDSGAATARLTIGQWGPDLLNKTVQVRNVELLSPSGDTLLQLKQPRLNITSTRMYVNGPKLHLYLINPSTGVKWKSSNPRIARVKNGTVTARSAGTATITATYEGQEYSCEIYVLGIGPEKLYYELPVGESLHIPVYGATVKSFKSSQTKYATVDAQGFVNGLKVGTTEIAVRCNNKRTYYVTINVINPAKSFETASEAVANMGLGWNLGSCLDTQINLSDYYYFPVISDFEAANSGCAATAELIRYVQSCGFNTIRLNVTWYQHMSASGTVNYDWMNRVQELVDQILDAGMYCILNVYGDCGYPSEYEGGAWILADSQFFAETRDRAEYLWKQIATRFRDYPEELLFEGFNMIVDPLSNTGDKALSEDATDMVNAWNQLFVATVRATGSCNKARNLIVNTYGARLTEHACSAFRMPEDTVRDHLIVGAQVYEPKEMTRRENYSYVPAFSSKMRSEIDTVFKNMNVYFISKGLPVIVTEFGSRFKSYNVELVSYFSYVVQQAHKQGAACCVWDDNLTTGLIDRYHLTQRVPEIVSNMMNSAGQGKYDTGGEKTAEALMRKWYLGQSEK